MNTYMVTWIDDFEDYRTEQVDSTDIITACYGIGCNIKNIVSITQIYKVNN